METLGLHHVGLAVCKLRDTLDFFIDTLGWQIAKELPDYPAYFVTNGEAFVTLWQTEEGAAPFNRRTNVGLHHFAIRVSSDADLQDIYGRVMQLQNVTLDFAPEPLGEGPSKHFMVFEPSGIRIEFIYVPG